MSEWAPEDNPSMFEELPPRRQNQLLDWISNNLVPRKTFNTRHTSYGLKHQVKFDDDSDEYFYNGEFKGAMQKAGFLIQNADAQNWVFNISDRSPLWAQKK